MVSKTTVLKWIEMLASSIAENKQYLTKLDSPIGDADHGTNMNRGFKKVIEKMPEYQDKDIGSVLKGVGIALVSSVGGASGPLYGTFFMRAGTAVTGKEELSVEDVLALFDSGLQGVIQRGKAELGDKTMVDTLTPTVESLRKDVTQGSSLEVALSNALDAAEKGMEDTIPMQARKGRASYVGERSIGHQDPGATSTYLMVKAAAEAFLDG